MSYRPKGFVNPYPTHDGSGKELGNTCGFACEHEAFEEGADAILQYLLDCGIMSQEQLEALNNGNNKE